MQEKIAVIGLPGSGVQYLAEYFKTNSNLEVSAYDRICELDLSTIAEVKLVFVTRYAFTNLVQMRLMWRSQNFLEPVQPNGWWGEKWSFELIPNAEDLIGKPIFQIIAAQYEYFQKSFRELYWAAADRPRAVISLEEFFYDHAAMISRINRTLDVSLLDLGVNKSDLPLFPDAQMAVIAEVPRIGELISAEANFRAEVGIKPVGAFEIEQPVIKPAANDFDRSSYSYSDSFVELLQKSESTLAFSTYSSGLVGLMSADSNILNIVGERFPKAMGLAASQMFFAVGGLQKIYSYTNRSAQLQALPAYRGFNPIWAPQFELTTGDIAVHDLAFDDNNELWCVNTRFSCLSKLVFNKSFTVEWMPPWLSGLTDGDACHLNGLAMRAGSPKYVTALATTSNAGEWRSKNGKAGVIYDIVEDRFIAQNLAMPHSPRWYRESLYFLESGVGGLNRVSLETGQVETIATLPGFTRGLAFIGKYAVVGLSQVRDSVFSDLSVTNSKAERNCGFWVVDLESGEVKARFKFETEISEIFDVVLLPHQSRPQFLQDLNLLRSMFTV